MPKETHTRLESFIALCLLVFGLILKLYQADKPIFFKRKQSSKKSIDNCKSYLLLSGVGPKITQRKERDVHYRLWHSDLFSFFESDFLFVFCFVFILRRYFIHQTTSLLQK